MITKWKLFNFKSVRNETELILGPLTILSGPNSSGKSTWTQSMLLISQTLSSRVSSRSVVLNGNLTRLGQFDDLRSFGSEAEQILIGWECSPQIDEQSAGFDGPGMTRRLIGGWGFANERLQNVSCELSFDVDPSSSQRDLMQLQPRLFGCSVSCLTRTRDSVDVRSVLRAARAGQPMAKVPQVPDLDSETARSLDYDIELDENSMEELRSDLTSVEAVGCTFRHFLPDRLSIRFDKTELEAARIFSAIYDQRPSIGYRTRYLYSEDREIMIPESVVALLKERLGKIGQSLLGGDDIAPLSAQDWQERMRRLSRQDQFKLRQALQDQETSLADEIRQIILSEKGSQYTLASNPLPRTMTNAVRYLNYFFSNWVKYLGPLRDEPKPLYPLAATTDPSDIGLRGEYTAAVLDLHKDRLITYIPTSNFVTPAVRVQTTARSLEAAVLDWLHYMGVAEKVETHDRGKLGHELKVTTSGTDMPQDLTHVGVGVSQVLPILVMCLLADKDTALIIEQPELHLHPKVQTLLADFFLSMSLLGKQCIIETHSEYIINRLRFRAASAPGNELSSLVRIYFVEKQEGVSSFREVQVNEYGAIVDWPDGFFDQSQSEAEEILRAATLKRKKAQRGGRTNA